MYNERVVFKKRMIKAKKEYEKTKDPKLVKEIARCHNIQWSKKIALNSLYAVGNQYFRYYDVRQCQVLQLVSLLFVLLRRKLTNI